MRTDKTNISDTFTGSHMEYLTPEICLILIGFANRPKTRPVTITVGFLIRVETSIFFK